VAHRIDSLGLITELVAAGLGVGLMVADGPTHPGVCYVDLDGAAGSRRIYACTRPGRRYWRNNAAVITAVAAALATQPAPLERCAGEPDGTPEASAASWRSRL
jgi:hypothetical protein